MKEKKPWYKKLWVWITVIIVMTVIITIPFFINELYKWGNTTGKGYYTEWGASDVLSFYGAILSFLGTVVLSTLALWQNKKLSDENDKYRQYLEMKDMPLFEIKVNGSTGQFQNVNIVLNNITQNIAHNLVFYDFIVKDAVNQVVMNCSTYTVQKNYLSEFETMSVTYRNNPITITDFKNVSLNFSFSYSDVFGKKHTCSMERKMTSKSDFYGIFTLIEENIE